jgi:hypothetical protein
MQEIRCTAVATGEAAAAMTEATSVDAAANAEKVVRDKAYHATDDAAEEDRVAEATALAMAWSLLGKEEEEDHWQVRRTHRRITKRDLDHREHEEESPVAMQAREVTTIAMLRDAASCGRGSD